MKDILMITLIVLLVMLLVFLFLRWYWCWYFKINARLHEQERTNELLQNIFDALIQGNTVNAVTAGQIMGMNESQSDLSQPGTINSSDIPEL